MSRTIVYPPSRTPVVVATPAAVAGAPAGATLPPAQPPDNIPEKLVKYVPAEVVAFYIAVYALMQGQLYQWIILVVGLLGTALHFWARADMAQPPRWWFYPLAITTFFAWALGTSSVGNDLFGWPEFISQAALPTAVFFVPLLDEALTKWSPAWLQWP